MRVTESLTYRNFLASIEDLNGRMEEASRQLSSGKKLLSLKDSPSASAELVDLRNELSQVDQYRTNSDSAGLFLGVADSALNSAHNIVTAIFSRGSAAASNSNSPGVVASIAADVRSLRDQLLSIANAEASGRFIFAGSKVRAPAFTIAGDTVTYQGDAEVNKIAVGDGLQVKQNVSGSAIFDSAFADIKTLLTALDSGNRAGIQSALGQFSSALGNIGQFRAQIGGDLSTLQNVTAEQGTRELSLKTRRGQLEDADLAEAVTQLARIQTSLNAALSAHTISGRKNLFDFLG